jgi:hypothetical protein
LQKFEFVVLFLEEKIKHMPKKMNKVVKFEEELKSLYEKSRKALETNEESLPSDVQKFTELGTNHIKNFQTRIQTKQKAFFHQHDRMRDFPKEHPNYEMAKGLRDGAEKKIIEYGDRALQAIEKDFADILDEIKQRPIADEDDSSEVVSQQNSTSES